MQKRTSSNAAHKTWNILRLALLWPRKGGVLIHTRRLVMHLSNFITTLRHTESGGRRGAHYYAHHRQLSFGNTPASHIKIHRPNSRRFRFPCINPEVDFHYDFGDESNDVLYQNKDGARKSFLTNVDHDENINGGSHQVCDHEERIDLKAEQFITKFYEHLKLQRQISFIQYN